MWYCTKCGTANEGAFCVNCGKAKTQTQPEVNNVENIANNTVASPKKTVFKSPLFIVAAICALLGLFFTFVSWFMPSTVTNLIYSIKEILINADIYDSEISYILDELAYASIGLNFIYVLLNIILNVPSILFAIGLVMMLCKKEKSGISLIKGGIITNIVYLSITLFVILLGYIGALSEIGSYSYYMDGVITGLIISAIIIIAIYVLAYIYYAHLLSILKIATAAVDDMPYTKNPSLYVAVMNIIGGALGGLFGLVAVIRFATITNFVSLVSSVGLLLFGILIINKRNTQSKVNIEAPASQPGIL